MRSLPSAATGACFFLLAGAAQAGRPIFEPTDLELEDPGTAELDFQFGITRTGEGTLRGVVPDFELDLGLSSDVELDIDGAFAVEDERGAPVFFRAAPDNLWFATKIGLFDWRDPTAHTAWAMGAQLGPKYPVAVGAHGMGFEGLLLVGRALPGMNLVLNLGGLVDPGAAIASGRPRGWEGGLDLRAPFASKRWAFTSELAGVHFLSDDDDQVHATVGMAVEVGDTLELSSSLLVGFLPGGDRLGVLVGVSPKWALVR